MGTRTIGIVISGQTSREIISNIQLAEELGIKAAWLTTRISGRDALTIFSASLASTNEILLGSSIIPIWSRHPMAVATQVQVLTEIAPGRIRLGVGPGNQDMTEKVLGVEFRQPLEHLKEYMQILKAILQHGSVDFDGRYYSAHAKMPNLSVVPILGSALRARAFELCGAECDGAISWLNPKHHLREVAKPALEEGAKHAGRERPLLIAHVPVCLEENQEKVRASTEEQLAIYPPVPAYQRMFVEAGFPEATRGVWSQAMIDSVVISGNETTVKDKILDLFSMGADEVLISPITVGADRQESLTRTLQVVANITQSII